MFTILPSLYFIGVRYFQQWKTPYIPNDQCQKIKTRRKKFDHRRRKTSISELSHDDTVYLINETGFTREEIFVWYKDFLVCIFINNLKEYIYRFYFS